MNVSNWTTLLTIFGSRLTVNADAYFDSSDKFTVQVNYSEQVKVQCQKIYNQCEEFYDNCQRKQQLMHLLSCTQLKPRP